MDADRHEPHLLFATSGRVPAAFSTRVGGVSAPPFDSLNFGNPGELPAGIERDPKTNITENFARLARALGAHVGADLARRALVQVHQVHGAAVHLVRAADREAHSTTIDWGTIKADAIVTDDPRVLLAVRVADCAPILAWSACGRVVAAVHAGWRGVVSGVLPEALRAMRELLRESTPIEACVGPCISAEHFEIGPEVVAEFERAFGARAPISRRQPSGKAHADIPAALLLQCEALGVRATSLARCTVGEPGLFFSHRRDRGVTGRMVGVIGPAERPTP
ncbi:MAG: polyphenol oxidase family protein [Planctomycetota bacterium]|nr:polyphenol oxidase family protein [Planctomycetota bacterium]